jgi:hypothetical protein
MALPASGAISFNAINVELGLTATAQISLNDSAVRTLFGVSSGAIAMNVGYGKANRVSVTVTIAANTTNYTLGTAQIPGYVAGKTDVTFVVNSGVYVYSTSTANAGLTVAALNAADTVSIVNNGYIMGKGGNGGYSNGTTEVITFLNGGPALTINRNVSITNNSYIAGGGGGGRRGVGGTAYTGSGGGGAGGGSSWDSGVGGLENPGGGPGQAGIVPAAGSAGTSGGRILPGSLANQAGGRGASSENGSFETEVDGTAGGLTNQPGASQSELVAGCIGGSGGGGWGAAGGNVGGGINTGGLRAGGTGGKAVNLNGNTVTWVVTGTRYGVIS